MLHPNFILDFFILLLYPGETQKMKNENLLVFNVGKKKKTQQAEEILGDSHWDILSNLDKQSGGRGENVAIKMA